MHETSCVATPQQNGRVEFKHRQILDIARTLRFQVNLPLHFWEDCVLIVAYLINRTLIVENKGITPYELLFKRAPNYEHLRTFGCLCYKKNDSKGISKFDPRAEMCIFVGYPQKQKG